MIISSKKNINVSIINMIVTIIIIIMLTMTTILLSSPPKCYNLQLWSNTWSQSTRSPAHPVALFLSHIPSNHSNKSLISLTDIRNDTNQSYAINGLNIAVTYTATLQQIFRCFLAVKPIFKIIARIAIQYSIKKLKSSTRHPKTKQC